MTKPNQPPKAVISHVDQFPAVVNFATADDYLNLLIGRITRAWGNFEAQLHSSLVFIGMAKGSREDVADTLERRFSQVRSLAREFGPGGESDLYKRAESLLSRTHNLARKRHLISHGQAFLEEKDGTLAIRVMNGRAMEDYSQDMKRTHERMLRSGDNRRWREKLAHPLPSFTFDELAAIEADIVNLGTELYDLLNEIDAAASEQRIARRLTPDSR